MIVARRGVAGSPEEVAQSEPDCKGARRYSHHFAGDAHAVRDRTIVADALRGRRKVDLHRDLPRRDPRPAREDEDLALEVHAISARAQGENLGDGIDAKAALGVGEGAAGDQADGVVGEPVGEPPDGRDFQQIFRSPGTLSCADPFEDDNSLTNAAPHLVGIDYLHRICPGGDPDYMAINMSSSVTYTLQAIAQDVSLRADETKPVLQIFASQMKSCRRVAVS